MEVKRLAPANLVLAVARTTDTSGNLKVVISQWTCEDIQSVHVRPEAGGEGNAINLLDLGFADDGTVGRLPVVMDVVLREAEFADELAYGELS